MKTTQNPSKSKSDYTNELKDPGRKSTPVNKFHNEQISRSPAGKEVGGLTSLCAVDHMGNDGLKEICAVEEIKRINIGVDSGAAASVWPRDLCKYCPNEEDGEARRASIMTTTGNESST